VYLGTMQGASLLRVHAIDANEVILSSVIFLYLNIYLYICNISCLLLLLLLIHVIWYAWPCQVWAAGGYSDGLNAQGLFLHTIDGGKTWANDGKVPCMNIYPFLSELSCFIVNDVMPFFCALGRYW
jgi:hypothetical protein